MNYQTISRSIVRIKLRTATDEDRRIINDWLDENKANHQIYKDITRYKSIYRRLVTESELRDNLDLETVKINILEAIARHRQARRRVMVWGMAAACLIGIISTVLLNLIPMFDQESSVPQFTRFEGEGQVTLILPSGNQIDLQRNGDGSIQFADGTIVSNEELPIYIDDIADPIKIASRNRIVTGTGGFYSFTLSDGTHVWLNAQSEIIYPARFIEDQRVVELNGEAYFEVAADADKPFIVKTAETLTKVLGTSFNISAYSDEETIRTSLVSGRVEVSFAGNNQQKVTLEPGMQSVWLRRAGQFYLQVVHIEDVMSWRSGEYIFRKTPLNDILRSLSRWYEVEFENEAGDLSGYSFSGKIAKGDLLLYALETFTLAGGPLFEVIDNTTIRIKKK